MKYSLTGFNGQRPDPVSGHHHLGNGYRAYSPLQGRFTAPDGWSPFDAGGINPYAYCAGDPINRADPSGHFSLGEGIGMALGFVAGIALSIVTEGAAMPVALTLMATLAGDAGIGAGAELATGAIDDQQINWGQVGTAAGLSTVMSLAGFGLAQGAMKLANGASSLIGRLQRVNGRIGIPMSGEFRNPRFLGMYDATMNIDRAHPMSMMFDQSYNYNRGGPLNLRNIIIRLNKARPRRAVFHEWNGEAGEYVERQLSARQLAECTFDNHIGTYSLHFVDEDMYRSQTRGFTNQYRINLRQLALPGNDPSINQMNFRITEEPAFRWLVSPPRIRGAGGMVTGQAAQAYLNDIETRFAGQSYVIWDRWCSRPPAHLW